MAESDDLKERLAKALACIHETGLMPDGQKPRCILCNQKQEEEFRVALFFPDDSKRYSGSGEKVAVLIYILCENCYQLPEAGRDERVEEILKREASLQ